MYKFVALLARKPGISHADFVAYYENNHVPLIRSLLPQPIDYRRSYIDPENPVLGEAVGLPDFDVITELWFTDKAAYEAMIATASDPVVSNRIARDEENFLDRGKHRMFVVDERTSGPSH